MVNIAKRDWGNWNFLLLIQPLASNAVSFTHLQVTLTESQHPTPIVQFSKRIPCLCHSICSIGRVLRKLSFLHTKGYRQRIGFCKANGMKRRKIGEFGILILPRRKMSRIEAKRHTINRKSNTWRIRLRFLVYNIMYQYSTIFTSS